MYCDIQRILTIIEETFGEIIQKRWENRQSIAILRESRNIRCINVINSRVGNLMTPKVWEKHVTYSGKTIRWGIKISYNTLHLSFSQFLSFCSYTVKIHVAWTVENILETKMVQFIEWSACFLNLNPSTQANNAFQKD